MPIEVRITSRHVAHETFAQFPQLERCPLLSSWAFDQNDDRAFDGAETWRMDWTWKHVWPGLAEHAGPIGADWEQINPVLQSKDSPELELVLHSIAELRAAIQRRSPLADLKSFSLYGVAPRREYWNPDQQWIDEAHVAVENLMTRHGGLIGALAPSCYFLYEDGDDRQNEARNLERFGIILRVACDIASLHGLEVRPFITHRFHHAVRPYGYKIVPDDQVSRFIQFLAEFRHDGKGIDGLDVWDGDNYYADQAFAKRRDRHDYAHTGGTIAHRRAVLLEEGKGGEFIVGPGEPPPVAYHERLRQRFLTLVYAALGEAVNERIPLDDRRMELQLAQLKMRGALITQEEVTKELDEQVERLGKILA